MGLSIVEWSRWEEMGSGARDKMGPDGMSSITNECYFFFCMKN